MVQEMIVSAFSALGFQGNDVTSMFWIVDSGASNHMTNSTSILKTVRKYQGPSQIQIDNGSKGYYSNFHECFCFTKSLK